MRALLELAFQNYHFYIWLVIAVTPAVLYGVRKSAKIGQSAVHKTGYAVLVMFAALFWSNGLFKLYGHVPLAPTIRAAAVVLASAVFGVLLGPVCAFLLRRINRLAHKPILSENALFFALTAIWSVQLVLQMPDQVQEWQASSYVVNYSMGFSSRFMIGSILRLLAGSFVSAKEMYWFCFACYVILIVLCSALLNRFYKSVPQTCRPAALFGIACFVACPGSIAALWGDTSFFGKLDYYGLILSLLGVIAFRKIRSVPLRYLCLTMCACFAISIYQGYVFLYYSILAVVIIEDWMRENTQENRQTLKAYS